MTVPSVPFHSSPSLVLASGSPRRRELLTRAGVRFEVRPSGIDETRVPGEGPRPYAVRLAREKALDVRRQLPASPRRLVLGADTIVVLGDDVLGKPESPDHAVALLSRLVGRVHRVLTAVAIVTTGTHEARDVCVESTVTMRAASLESIRAYVATGEPLDKAGAYAAQGEGRRFIERIDGSETNVIGLPLEETLALLHELEEAAGAAGAVYVS
jgi:septum formation protein